MENEIEVQRRECLVRVLKMSRGNIARSTFIIWVIFCIFIVSKLPSQGTPTIVKVAVEGIVPTPDTETVGHFQMAGVYIKNLERYVDVTKGENFKRRMFAYPIYNITTNPTIEAAYYATSDKGKFFYHNHLFSIESPFSLRFYKCDNFKIEGGKAVMKFVYDWRIPLIVIAFAFPVVFMIVSVIWLVIIAIASSKKHDLQHLQKC